MKQGKRMRVNYLISKKIHVHPALEHYFLPRGCV
jgi:hypothetical protein